jgi:hypothetical protein
MVVPIFYRFEKVDKQLLDAVYTVRLPSDDAARLKSKMLRKRKNNLVVLLVSAALFFCGLILPFLFYTRRATHVIYYLKSNTFILIGMLIISFISLLAAILASNKYFGVAGAYLKALRIAYPALPCIAYEDGNNHYSIKGVYSPKEYRTNTKNKGLLDSLVSGKVNPPRARGLLNYAICRYSKGRIIAAFSFIFSFLLLAVWAFLKINNIHVSIRIIDYLVYPVLEICGGVLLLSGIRAIFIIVSNYRYIQAVKTGYPSLHLQSEMSG